MILRTCDKCGREMEPIYFPPYCASPDATEFRSQLIISVTEPNGKLRPLDICDKCNVKIMDYIFNNTEVTTNG